METIMNTKNLDAALKAIEAESGAPVADEDMAEFIARIDQLIAAAQGLKAPHKNWLAAEASRRSRAKKAEELAAMKARLAELEGGTAK
jgi:hypothetical protein